MYLQNGEVFRVTDDPTTPPDRNTVPDAVLPVATEGKDLQPGNMILRLKFD